MANEWTGPMIIDEIERLFVAYNKAKEYLTKITLGIEQQIDVWQHRQQLIRDQLTQTKTSSYDFLLPKTQRINEVTLEAVQALCRTDLLIEQILRIDLKSRITPSSTRPLDTGARQAVSNGKFNGPSPIPVPVLRTQLPTSSSHLSPLMTQENVGFEPVRRQSTENTTRPPSALSQHNHHYSGTDAFQYGRTSMGTRTPQSDRLTPTNPIISNYSLRQPPRSKEKLRLERIAPGTKWKQAKIDIIDSLSGFYVGNLDSKVHEKFLRMQDELHDHYNNLQRSNQLMPLENVAIGDFGVAKYSQDSRWYRARLITSEEHQQIKIVFVDFGNIEIKSMKEFFPLWKLFTDLPAQAIACSLSEAYPPDSVGNEGNWPEETIEIFRKEVSEKSVEVHFVNEEEGTKQWPLHFVKLLVNNRSVADSPRLQKRIDLRPNHFIAKQMAPSLSQEEYILFNVPINDDDFE